MAEEGFDWNEYLVLARNLVDHISGEASARASSSRAYYAAFWKARQILEANEVTVPRINVHRFVWDAFIRSWNNEGASIGKLGDTLKSFRVKADYVPSPPMTKADAEIAVASAEDLIEDLEAISESAKATAIKKAQELMASPEYQTFRA